MIVVEALSKSFVRSGRFGRRTEPLRALDDLDFRAADAAITGLLGANGAGKTTTLRIVAGLLPPDGGRVVVDGIDVLAQPRVALARLGCLADARGLYPRLTARENIIYFGRLQGMAAAAAGRRADELGEILHMGDLLHRRTEGFSQGEKMKTALARALVHDPPNLVLDEPTNGLDIVTTRRLREALRHLASPAGGGKCIVFSSHIMQEVRMLCDEVTIIAEGRRVASGTVAALCQQAGSADFEEAFLKLAFPEEAVTP